MIITKKVPFGYLLDKIKFDLLWVCFIGGATELFLYFTANLIPSMAWNIPAFTGTAISILLSFKMSQSYDRWWEARKIWGAIVNDSRSLILQLFQFCDESKQALPIHTIAMYQIAWCYELAYRLKGQLNHEKLNKLLAVAEKDFSQIKHLPLWINKQQIKAVKSLRTNQAIDAFAHTQLDDTLKRLIASMKDIQLVFHIPLLFIMAFIFFSLEKSSFSLQDPFHNHLTDVPIFTISETIEGNIMELLDKEFQSTKQFDKGFYQL